MTQGHYLLPPLPCTISLPALQYLAPLPCTISTPAFQYQVTPSWHKYSPLAEKQGIGFDEQ